MPGDTFGISAALALTPELNLILLVDRNLADNKDGQIRGFYAECGLTGRVTEIDITNFKAPLKRIWREFHQAQEAHTAPALVAWEPGYNEGTAVVKKNDKEKVAMVLAHIYLDVCANAWPEPVEEVTGMVGGKFKGDSEAAFLKVAETWKMISIKAQMSEEVDAYFKAKKLNDLKKRVVVLWSRQSGKRGGAHIELDSSFAGIKQLAALFCGNCSVILAGDEKFKSPHDKSDGKLAAIAKSLPNVVDLSNMWDDPLWAKFKENGVNRLAQLLVYRHLAESHAVVHVGMRSGNLEGMALLGMKTFFLEPETCKTGDRMIAFEEGGIPYCRIQLKRMPGLTARWGTDFSYANKVPASSATLEEAVKAESKQYMLKPPPSLVDSAKIVGNYKGGIPGKIWSALTTGGGGQLAEDYQKARALAIRKDVKGIPLTLLSWDDTVEDSEPQLVTGAPPQLPAIDGSGMVYMRGFTTEDLHKISAAVMRCLYKT